MEYKSKHKLWKELHSTDAVEKDIELLRKKNPSANSLKSINHLLKHNKGRLEKEILYELLDVAKEKEIRENRKKEISIPSVSDTVKETKSAAADKQPPAKKKSPKKKNTRK